MFDIGFWEFVIVAIVAILVVGPKELPALLRTLGRMLGKLRKTADEFRKHFDDAVREAGAEDLQREVRALQRNNPLTQIRDSIEEASRDPLKSGERKPAPAIDDEGYVDDDDLGPPPPLPPKGASETSATTPGRTVSAGNAETGAAPQTAAASSNGAETGNSSDHEIRVNGEHRATN